MRIPGLWANGRAIASISSQLLCALAPEAMATVIADKMALYWSGVKLVNTQHHVSLTGPQLTILHAGIDILHGVMHGIPLDLAVFANLGNGARCG